MNGLYFKFFIAVFLFVCLDHGSYGQRSNGLTVEGTVSVEEGSVEGAVIQMYRDGKRLDNYGIGSDGKYKVELNYNHEFILIYTREGNFSQKIVVNTNVPRQVLMSDPLFPPFPVNINLFTEIPGIDRTFSENTVLKIYYSEKVDNFISDLYYNDAQIKHLIDQAILQSQMIDQEADYLASLTKAELAELRKEYDHLIEQAESEYNNEKFIAALDGYKAASRIFPDEQYPKDRIAEINDLLGMIMVAGEMERALAERLETLIKQGDLHFERNQLEEAKNSYQRALSVRPGHLYATEKVAEINEILKARRIEQDYKTLITGSDNSFKELLYAEAEKGYQQALQLKPDESYPKERIEEIKKIREQQALNAEKQNNYEESLFHAELMFEKQFYEKAISFYENALNYKPGDSLATNKIREINELMNELANRSLYDKFIETADKAYKKEKYEEALADYEQASGLFQQEQHPISRIEEINKILDRERNFNRLISQADLAFDEKQFIESRGLYVRALEIYSDDEHAQIRIKEIDGILDEQARLAAIRAEKDSLYSAAVRRGDSLFTTKQYEPARTAYQSALQVKPDESYPQERINEINKVIRELELARLEQEQLDRNYQNAIRLADQQFNVQNYSQSIINYEKALSLKPEEQYPKEKVAVIDSILKQREIDENYRTIILAADGFFRTESYPEAKKKYEDALSLKPDENYPLNQINRIDDLLREKQEMVLAEQQNTIDQERENPPIAELSQDNSDMEVMSEVGLNKLYDEYIEKADGYFDSKQYNVSRAWYYKAWDLKPEETYPPARIDEINKIVNSLLLSQRDRDYQKFIDLADSTFRDNQLAVARGWYNRALSVKENQNYPKNQLQAIADLVAERMAGKSEQLFESHIKKADEAFKNENYNVARFWYKKALELRPDNENAKKQIEEIRNALK